MPLKLFKRGKIWHYRGTVAGRLLRGSTKTASKETAQRIAARREQYAWQGHFDPQSVLTFAQAAMLYRQAQKSDRFLRKIEVKRKAKEPVTWEWVQAFMAAARKPNLAALACFMYLTGARISQALAVRWADVDFQSRKVLIRATNKGDDDRRAHMPSELIAALANIPGDRTGQVFGFKSRGNCRTQWAVVSQGSGPSLQRRHRISLPPWLL